MDDQDERRRDLRAERQRRCFENFGRKCKQVQRRRLYRYEIGGGCVALNAFAMPTKLYSQNAKTKLEADITGLNVSDYRFRFSDLNGVTDNSLTYIVNYANSSAISGTLTDGAACCYIVAATDLSGNVTAYREFSVTVYYAEVQS